MAGANSTRTMTYDARDRLASTTFDDIAAPVTFTYDPLDNLRTYFTPYRIYTHQYDSATWRLTGIASATPATLYTYAYAGTAGARGNVTTRAKFSLPAVTHSYTFDQANRLRQLAGPTPQTYRYDGLGRRTRLTSGGVPRDQVYSQAGQLLYDKVGAPGSLTRTRYLYIGRHLVAKGVKPPSGAEVITYMHTDGLGSPIAETDTAGAMLSPTRTLHEPYGLVVWGTVNQGPGYTGHVTDVASGLNYMQQRYYDPVAGRFLSVDPVEANASTGASFNRYAYANNNPYKYIDPDGRASYVTGSHIAIRSEDKTVPSVDLPISDTGAIGVSTSDSSFHQYNVTTPSSLTPQQAGDGFRINPTPGQDMPASPGGTRNDVGNIPLMDGSNFVRSFSVPSPDPTRFTDITVNYTIAGEHKLTEGFVMRYGEIGASGVTLRSYGEGNNWRQNMLLKPVWGSQVDKVWQQNQRDIIETMSGN